MDDEVKRIRFEPVLSKGNIEIFVIRADYFDLTPDEK